MRLAILGAGGIGRGYAVLAAQQGHLATLWSPRTRLATDHLLSTGVIEGRFPITSRQSCTDAIAGADIVIVAVPGNAHRITLDAAAPCLQPGQVVIISSHCSFSGLYLSRLLAARGISLPIVAWATTALTAQRRTGPDGAPGVNISGLRSQLDVATLPNTRADIGLSICQTIFGERFSAAADLLAISLSNLNPPGHMANFLCNFTRAEKAEAWPNYGSITPSVARLIEALDSERLSLAAAFGLTVRSVHDHFHLSFGVKRGPLADMAAAVYGLRPELMGPSTTDTRFVTEDVPFGLLPITVIARAAGIDVPLHRAGIALFSALYGRDFSAENDLLPSLDLDRLTQCALHHLLRDGWPA